MPDHDDGYIAPSESPLGPEGCLFPGKCCMPGPHYESECHTAEMLQQQNQDLKSEQDAIQADYAKVERQERVRDARDEFNAIWKAEKATLAQAWRADMNRIELVAWRFFLRGKGLQK